MDKVIVLTARQSENTFSGYCVDVDIWNYGRVHGATFSKWESTMKWLGAQYHLSEYKIVIRSK